MNLQEKMFKAAADLRARTLSFAITAKRAAALQGSLDTLRVTGRSLDKVVRRHAARFMKENTTIARAARKDVSALARDTYKRFTSSGGKKLVTPTRKSASSRKRARARTAV